MGHSTVMLSAAKHLSAHRDRPFAASSLRSEQLWLGVTVEGRDKSVPTVDFVYLHQRHFNMPKVYTLLITKCSRNVQSPTGKRGSRWRTT